jgi:hypothetical protein
VGTLVAMTALLLFFFELVAGSDGGLTLAGTVTAGVGSGAAISGGCGGCWRNSAILLWAFSLTQYKNTERNCN